MSSSSPPPDSSSTSGQNRQVEEEVYDRYADQVLDGNLVEPEEFLAEHYPQAGAKLRHALEKLYKSATSGGETRLPFEQLGEYRLIKQLGRGGMGVVYEAEQTSLGRRVALKLVRPELWDSAIAVERFRREARTVAGLRHPNIVTVFAAGEENGIGYLAMELIEGKSLAEMMKAGELDAIPVATKLRWMADIARALHHAHAADIVHRDVKPSNIRITPDGRALLLDFGLVREEGGNVTLTDSFAGTPGYASPEQVTGSHAVDQRSDIYALGVTLYQCLTGQVPFEGPTVQALFNEILNSTPQSPRKLDPSVPRDVEVATLHAMHRLPERRYQSADDFANDLEAVLDLRAISARPPGAMERLRQGIRRHRALATAAVTSVIALAIIGGVTWWRSVERDRQDRDDALALVSDARDEIEAYGESVAEAAEITTQIAQLEELLGTNYVDPDEYDVLDRHAGRLANLNRTWDETYYRVLDLLRRAEALDPDVAERANDVRVELVMERYREVVRESAKSAEPYRELAREVIGDRPMPDELLDYREPVLVTDPPGAEIHLFKLVELSRLIEGGEPRLVPVAMAPDAEPLPVGLDRWSLLIEDDQGPLRRWDAIVEVASQPIEGTVLVTAGDAPLQRFDRLIRVNDHPVRDMGEAEDLVKDGEEERTFVFQRGDETFEVTGKGLSDWNAALSSPWDLVSASGREPVSAKVVRDRQLIDVELPPGLHTNPCAATPYLSERTKFGVTGEPLRVQRGSWYLAYLILPGYEPFVIDFNPFDGLHPDPFPLVEEGTTPAGFRRLPVWNDPAELLWVGECEVTAAEYLEFVNSPATLAAIDASEDPVFYPRMGGNLGAGPFWEVDEEGRFELTEIWEPDWPAVGVSYYDAVAYCEWRTAKARAEGLPYRFSLPTMTHRIESGGLGYLYIWGDHFRPRWTRSCFSYSRPRPGRTRQFPVDRTVHGVYDLSGCALEWLDTWWDENENRKFLSGGAWGQGNIEVFKLHGGMGGGMHNTSGETGFRVRLEIIDEN